MKTNSRFTFYIAILLSVIITIVLFVSPYIGWIKGHYDYYFGSPIYVSYGYIESDTSEFFRDGLKPYGVRFFNGGCIVGTFEYYFYENYNKAVVSHLPPNIFDKLYFENKIRTFRKHEDDYKMDIAESKKHMNN